MSAREDRTPSPLPRNNPLARLRELAKDLPPGPAPGSAVPSADAPEPKPARTYPGRVTVRRERKGHGGKAVTIAEGPGLAGHPLETYAKELAQALGSGARVERATLVVQGEQVDRVVAWLERRGFTGVGRGN